VLGHPVDQFELRANGGWEMDLALRLVALPAHR